MSMNRKIWIVVASIGLILCCTIGGTLAWLRDKTDPVKNTFTVGDINIELSESTHDYKMVPGNTIPKDPQVTVKEESEACWLFVKVEKSENFDTFMTFAIADGWTELSGFTGVYYREVDAETAKAGESYGILKNNEAAVRDDVTKQQLNGLTAESHPTLTFTAYAVQRDNIDDVGIAWTEAAK